MFKDLEYGPGRVFKGSVDDVTLQHYGAYDTYQRFGDAVYVMALATIVCKQRHRYRTLEPCHGQASLRPTALATLWVQKGQLAKIVIP